MVRRFWTAAVITVVVASALAYVSGAWVTTNAVTSLVGNHMPMVTATTADAFTAKKASLAPTGWTAVASDQQSSNPASYAIDGNQATFWHSEYSPALVPLPHSITIDMHATQYISGLTYLPRQDSISNGNIGQYSISVSTDGTNWGTPVVTGTWADDKSLKTANFSSVPARYVRLTALTEAGNRGPWTSAAEIGLLAGAPWIGQALPRTGWTASADSQQSGNPAGNALDGNSSTFWHSEYSPTSVPLPHSITIDMKSARTVSGLSYLPRQDNNLNGTIGKYAVYVSSDGSTWSSVASGTWADDHTIKYAAFPPVSARFVRLTALTEAGNRGPWTSAAEINLLGVASPIGPALPRAGWTASADSQQSGNAAGNALDGNGTTFWHSQYSPTAVPLPHSITIDMKSAQMVSGLSYLPRQDSILNGTIGKYAVYVSSDGSTWSSVASGTWADDHTTKYAVFPPVSARFVRLTALTEAGNRGPWTSAAEINIHGTAPTASVGGAWGAPIGFPEVPVSAVLLPNNKLLTFSAFDDMAYNTTPDTITKVSILDLNTGKVTAPIDVDTHHQMFCEGLAILADGRVLINGGSNDRATTIYDPTTNTWTVGPLMNIPRAYNADTLLSTGQVLTLGGSWYDSAGNKNGELFTPSGTTGSWQNLPGVLAANILTADPAGVYRADNHAWLFAQPGGTVFHAGPSKQTNWITTTGNGSITGAGNRADSTDAMNGNAVMYDIGKIVTLGGATAYQGAEATNSASTIDISGGPNKPVVFARTSNMAYARAFNNSVVLPDGKVLVVGGQQYPQPFTDTGAVLSPELWDPATGKFTVMAPETIPRTYHSVAILLPDGRVFSGGGGLCGSSCTTNHPDGQIYSPPYLFNPDGTARTRPVINTAPASATTGSTITVTTDSATPTFALIRMSAATHSVNNDQRRIPLTPTTVNGTTYTLQLPSDKGIVLPGNYMLFALNANGTPSVAKIINIR
ncbi:MAG: discoidin domain-containing protein [Mycobacterium sp.]|nr:discoidin domain-containing protein [Mycobacterium sp.]